MNNKNCQNQKNIPHLKNFNSSKGWAYRYSTGLLPFTATKILTLLKTYHLILARNSRQTQTIVLFSIQIWWFFSLMLQRKRLLISASVFYCWILIVGPGKSISQIMDIFRNLYRIKQHILIYNKFTLYFFFYRYPDPLFHFFFC